MSGICGKLVWDASAGASEGVVKRMTEALAHRGPDGEGHHFHTDEAHWLGLGHRLAAGAGEERGRGPVSDESGTVWAVHDGAIYNSAELRSELEQRGHHFRSQSDAEVIAATYREWEMRCLDRLQGMFAFAIWDAGRRRLVLGRDRTGIKPLCYSLDGGSLVFASEIKALIQDPALGESLDPAALDRYFSFGFIAAPHTVFRSVRKLLPGHVLVWQDRRAKIDRYYRYTHRTIGEKKKEGDWIAEFRDAFRRSVSRQMTSAAPVGAPLDGGIDSALVVWMMAQCAGERIKTFSVQLEQHPGDGMRKGRLVAGRFATDHLQREVVPEPGKVLPKLLWHLDEPFGDPAALSAHYAAEAARPHVAAVLSGAGADELFAGHASPIGSRAARIMRVLPSSLRARIGAALESRWAQRSGALRQVADAQGDLAERYCHARVISRPDVRPWLFSDAFNDHLAGVESTGVLSALAESAVAADAVERLTALDVELFLPGARLPALERMAAASSLEARFPFLDEPVLDVASRVPGHLKLRGSTTKYLLRRLASQALPPELCRSGEKAAPAPVGPLFRGGLLGPARSILLNSHTLQRGYFRQSGLEEILNGYERGEQVHARLIFALMCFELWCRNFVDKKGARALQRV